MDPSIGSLVVLALLGLVPGALVYGAVRPQGNRLEGLALAPVLSFGFTFLFGQAATILGVPFAPLPFLVAVGLVGLVAAARRSRRVEVVDRLAPAPPAARRLLLAAVTLGCLGWVLGLGGVAETPPYTDSANHGMMAAKVASQESLDPGRVLGSEALQADSPKTGTAFYPLALHGQTALAHRLAGVSFADGLLASTLLFSGIVLPLGLYVAGRRLEPGRPVVAGMAALLGATVASVPVLPMSFGGLPMVIGLAMVPAVGLTCVRHLLGGERTLALLGAIGLIGVLATHTSEIPLLMIIVGCYAAEGLWRRRLGAAALARRACLLGGLCLFLAGPTLPLLASGTSERVTIDEGKGMGPIKAAARLSTELGFHRGIDFLAILALAGLGVCLARRRHLALVAVTGVLLGLYFVAACLQNPWDLITVPWYQHEGRLALNLVLVEPFLAAVALCELGPALAGALRRERRDPAPVLAVAVVVGVMGFAITASGLRGVFHERAPVGRDAKLAFAYLKGQVQPGERVLNDWNTDGALWMYPFEGVVPLMGLQPARPEAAWTERGWLVKNLTERAENPRVDELLTKYRVRFVYIDQPFQDTPRHIDVDKLVQTPGFCERFSQGTVRVLEVSDGPSCA